MMFSVVYFYLCTNLQKRHPLYYVDQWLLFRHCSDIPTHEEKCCCEKTEVSNLAICNLFPRKLACPFHF